MESLEQLELQRDTFGIELLCANGLIFKAVFWEASKLALLESGSTEYIGKEYTFNVLSVIESSS